MRGRGGEGRGGVKVRGALRGLLLADIGHQDDSVGRHSSPTLSDSVGCAKMDVSVAGGSQGNGPGAGTRACRLQWHGRHNVLF